MNSKGRVLFPPIAKLVRSSRLMKKLVELFSSLLKKFVKLCSFSRGVFWLSNDTLGKSFKAVIILAG